MYTIGRVSEMFNLPISTLRYYDKEGLFPQMKRVSGIRKFGETELETLNEESLKELPNDEMPEEIRKAYENAHTMIR